MSRGLLELLAQERVLLGEGAGAVLQPGELPREVQHEHEQEAQREQHERGRRVLDPEQVGHLDEQVGEDREHRQHEADREPQHGVLGAQAAAAHQVHDESDHRRGEDDDEDVRFGAHGG